MIFLLNCFVVLSIAHVALSCSTKASSPTCIFTRALPWRGKIYMPSIGNGYLATLAMGDTIHLAGVYNGKSNITYYGENMLPLKGRSHRKSKNRPNVAHRARFPSPAAINFTLDVPGVRSYALDMHNGLFYQWFDGASVNIEQKIYVHRVKENLIVNEITVQTSKDLILNLFSNRGQESSDITFQNVDCSSAYCKATVGTINYPEIDFRTKVAMVWTPIPMDFLRIEKSKERQTFRFLTSVASNIHSSDPLKTSLDAWKNASLEKDLFSSHVKEWHSLWTNASISVKGNLELSQIISSSLYYTLSSLNERFQHGISPGGLAGGEEYLGHVFWDQDVWMYPSMLMLHPTIGKSLVEYRYKRMNTAKLIAKKYKNEGARYPWESALSGYEVCPSSLYGFAEVHINGDIAFGMRQYYFATKDEKWWREKGYDVVFQTAKFWASYVKYDAAKDRYVIKYIMPPDEDAWPCDNSIYTNTIAKLNLEIAIEYGRLLKIKTPKLWETIASKMYLPFDSRLQYHPEYEGFDLNRNTVKQADTILINFPLMIPMSDKVKENDLKYYAKVTIPNGPAMTHSMFAIGWLDIGNTANAAAEFKMNYRNVIGPFKVWSEGRGAGASNFLTGAGGFLQAVLFGYGGLRLKADGLYFNLQLPPGTTEFVLKGVNYIGNSLQFNISSAGCSVSIYLHTTTYLYVKQGDDVSHLTKTKPINACKGKIFHKSA